MASNVTSCPSSSTAVHWASETHARPPNALVSTTTGTRENRAATRVKRHLLPNAVHGGTLPAGRTGHGEQGLPSGRRDCQEQTVQTTKATRRGRQSRLPQRRSARLFRLQPRTSGAAIGSRFAGQIKALSRTRWHPRIRALGRSILPAWISRCARSERSASIFRALVKDPSVRSFSSRVDTARLARAVCQRRDRHTGVRRSGQRYRHAALAAAGEQTLAFWP